MVAAFEGWNDAADAATGVVDHLIDVWDAQVVARRRPGGVLRLPGQPAHGVDHRRGHAPDHLALDAGLRRPPPGSHRDVVLLRGIEPNMQWRQFCAELLACLPTSSAVELVVTLGALLAETPHTRPDPGQRHRHRARPRGPAQAGASHLRGPDRHRRRVPGRVRRGSTSPPSRSGPPSPTTCRSRPAPRPPWRCSARSRTCSRPASRWATCPRTAAPGSAASPSSPRRTRTSRSTSATSRRARTPPSSPRPAARPSPASSSATSSAATRRRSEPSVQGCWHRREVRDARHRSSHAEGGVDQRASQR